MTDCLATRLAQRLAERQAQALYRNRPVVQLPNQANPTDNQVLINQQNYINFCSNDYLGLAADPRISQAVCAALQPNAANHIGFGSGASHLVSGHYQIHHQLEQDLADWLGTESALLFSTGYMANIAVQQALLQKGDLIIGDKLNHASLIDGALASQADFKRFAHLDYQHLSRILQANQQPDQARLIVSDSIFSMDGDQANLQQLATIADQNQAWLLIDDAHGIGCIGEQGKGAFAAANIKIQANHIYIGTFGKAFGVSGAFVAGSKLLIENLIQFARPYIYTTAMPQANALAISTALKIIQTDEKLREKLRSNIEMFKTGAKQLGLNLIASDSAIQPILLGSSQTALDWSEKLKQQGFWVAAIRPPTVPQNQARLRITLSATHSQKQIEQLLAALKLVQNQANQA